MYAEQGHMTPDGIGTYQYIVWVLRDVNYSLVAMAMLGHRQSTQTVAGVVVVRRSEFREEGRPWSFTVYYPVRMRSRG